MTKMKQNGVIVDASGNIVAVVHGWTGNGKLPAGQMFRPVADLAACVVGQPAPPALSASMLAAAPALAASDRDMARVTEDLIAALIAKKVIASTDLPAASLAKVNARRKLRGETQL